MNSKFVVYSSSDVGGPGLITGLTGSLIPILDACLVTGYGSKPSAGWSKPIGNYSASLGSVPILGCYQNISGSGMTLFVNDAGGNISAGGTEAWATGWENITALTSSNTANMTGSVGAGSGQFPTPAQLLTGNVAWRKSVAASSTGRFWEIFADASTFYIFISTGDTTGVYYAGMFGDVFSLMGASDAYRCMIIGRAVENSAVGAPGTSLSAGAGNDMFDAMYFSNVSGASPLVQMPGHYLARTFGGGGASVLAGKHFDGSKAQCATGISTGWLGVIIMAGAIQTPNGPDNSLYLTPVTVYESSGIILRGRLRGIYQICHPISSFSDGQTFAGANDYAGKTFVVIKQGVNGGFWAMETSATLETN